MKSGSISSRNSLEVRSVVNDVDDAVDEWNETERRVRTQFSTSPTQKNEIQIIFVKSDICFFLICILYLYLFIIDS